MTTMSSVEDPRKIALKKGLHQLHADGLKRLIRHLKANKPVLLDRDVQGRANYSDGVYCPIAIGLELDYKQGIYNDEAVATYLSSRGYALYNTRGVAGRFYTSNRREDLLVAAKEVLEEKLNG